MTDTTRWRPRVILASAGVGAGHNQAARAILAGLGQADPTIKAEWLDVLSLAEPAFGTIYSRGYELLVTHLPRLYGWGYRFNDRHDGPKRRRAERLRLRYEGWALRRFTRWLADQGPALVVNTHFISAPAVSRLIRRQGHSLRQMVVVTDYRMHRFWCSEDVDRWFVPDDFARDRLASFGVDPERVDLTGLPVHPQWRHEADTAELRRQWDIPESAPVVLLSGGANFTVGRVDVVADRLARQAPQAVLIVLAGGNKKLLARLARHRNARGDKPRIRPIGFTDRMPDLVQLADVMVTKSGGMTVSEILTKGVATVLLKPVPGQEAHNAEMLCRQGAAVQTHNTDEVVARVLELLGDEEARRRLAENARRLDRPSTEMIVDRILQAVRELREPG